MSTAEVLSILAVLLSPLIAVQVSELLQRRRERRDRRLFVFRSLMTTRASGLDPEHVRALNMIDVEFHGSDKKTKAVVNAWKAYLDHLNTKREATPDLWDKTKEDLLVTLLSEMARHLGYDFDSTHIRRAVYVPILYGETWLDQQVLRKGLVALMKGERSFPIFLTGMNPPDAGPAAPTPPAAPGNPPPALPPAK